MTWTHLDTFSGIGGFALAAAWTGRIQTVQFVEIDPWCRRVLAKHWPGVPIHDDIRTFLADAEQFRLLGDCGAEDTGGTRSQGSGIESQESQAGRLASATGNGCEDGRIDLLTGGFPCQPFSAAGKRGGESDDRYLWPELARVIRSTRPRYCLLENVPGIIGLAGGLDRVLADLGASGYATGTVVIPAAAVGAYHRRDRVWILAHAGESGRGTRVADLLPGRGESDAVGCGDAAHPDEQGEPVESVDGHAGRGQLRTRDAADLIGIGLEGQQPGWTATGTVERSGGGTETLRCLGDAPDGLSRLMAERPAFGPDWEAGIPRVTAHEADRVNKLKALGNAIVPQVAYELLVMLLAVDDEHASVGLT